MAQFFTYIKEKYNSKLCLILKEYCRNNKKLTKQNERLKYLLDCRRGGLIPTHVMNTTKNTKQLFTSSRISKELERIERKFQTKILNLQIREANYNINDLRREIKNKEFVLKRSLEKEEYDNFIERQKQRCKHIASKNKDTHSTKIERLRQGQLKKYNLKYNSDWFINMTSISFPENSKWLLSLGSKFALPVDNKNFSAIGLIADLEQWVQTLIDDGEKETVRARITNRILTYKRIFKNDDKGKFILSTYEDTRQFLKKHKDEIVITKSDKGNKTVVMYKMDYERGIKNLLDDKNTYKIIRMDPTQKLQKTNNNIVMNLYKSGHIDKQEKFRLSANSATAPRLYGLPKIHKPDVPLRPISSSVSVPCYNLSKYIGSVLKNIVMEEYNIKNSLQLKEKIEKITLEEDEILISLDVVSLFTNIPIHLAINNIMKKWNMIQNYTKIPRKRFLDLLNFCLKENNYFMYGGKTFSQIKGMPMGNPLSPIIADIVLDHLLEQSIEDLQKNNIQIKLLTKYVDDLFAIIKRKDEEAILKKFNEYHKNLKFTLEKEKNKSITYLDMRIYREKDKLITDWFAKSIASGRLINFESTQPIGQKINTARNLINRVMKISNNKFKKKNLQVIKGILLKNSFPIKIINNIIKKETNKITPRENINDHTSGNTKYYGVCFIPKLTENIKLKDIIENQNTKIAHKPNKTIRHLFTQTKDKIGKREQSNLVYEIKCTGNDREECEKVYIGTTKRNLGIRIDEHKADIRKGKQSTALAQHCVENGHKADFDNVRILDKEKKTNKRYTLESLRIQQRSDNAVNNKEDKDNTNKVYNLVLV